MKKNIFFQNKSFYFAIYACIIIIALITGANIYFNLIASRPKNIASIKKIDLPQKINSEKDKVLPVLNDKSKNYLTPEDKKIFQYHPPLQNKTGPDSIQKSDQNQIKENIQEKSETEKNTPTKNPTKKQIIKTENQDNNQTHFCSFDETKKMSWPVSGKILMDYNPDKLIYDKTLEQYRTNDSLSISAKIGDQVKASADGIVKLITKTDEDGNLIIIDHGNNWTSIYSQLQDNLLVNEGDYVKKGQIIGGVNSPTKYGILLGSHLDFKITHDDNSVNPKIFLAQK